MEARSGPLRLIYYYRENIAGAEGCRSKVGDRVMIGAEMRAVVPSAPPGKTAETQSPTGIQIEGTRLLAILNLFGVWDESFR